MSNLTFTFSMLKMTDFSFYLVHDFFFLGGGGVESSNENIWKTTLPLIISFLCKWVILATAILRCIHFEWVILCTTLKKIWCQVALSFFYIRQLIYSLLFIGTLFASVYFCLSPFIFIPKYFRAIYNFMESVHSLLKVWSILIRLNDVFSHFFGMKLQR